MKRNLTPLAAVLFISAIIITAAVLIWCAEPTLPADLAELPHGSVKDSVYTSESAELKFTVTEGWEFFQLNENNWSRGVHEDITAYQPNAEVYVHVAYEDLAAAGKTDCGEETYFDLMKEKTKKGNPVSILNSAIIRKPQSAGTFLR